MAMLTGAVSISVLGQLMHGAEASTCHKLGETRDEEIHSNLYSTFVSWGITSVE